MNLVNFEEFDVKNPVSIFNAGINRYKQGTSTFDERVISHYSNVKSVQKSENVRDLCFVVTTISDDGEELCSSEVNLGGLNKGLMSMSDDNVAKLYSELLNLYHNGKYSIREDINNIISILGTRKK